MSAIAPDLWTLEQLGEWLRVSEDTARKVANSPTFPEPIIPGGRGKNCKKVYFVDEVVDWLRKNRRAA